MRTFAILFLWLLGIFVLFWSGALPDSNTSQIVHLPLPQSYPWEGVLFFGVVLTVEITILGLILRPRNYYRSWGRALAAIVIFTGVSMFWAMGSLHQPTYYVVHVCWLLAVDLSMLTLLLVSWTSINRSAAKDRFPRH